MNRSGDAVDAVGASEDFVLGVLAADGVGVGGSAVHEDASTLLSMLTLAEGSAR